MMMGMIIMKITMIKISPTQSWKASRSAAGSFFFSITFRDFRSLQLTIVEMAVMMKVLKKLPILQPFLTESSQSQIWIDKKTNQYFPGNLKHGKFWWSIKIYTLHNNDDDDANDHDQLAIFIKMTVIMVHMILSSSMMMMVMAEDLVQLLLNLLHHVMCELSLGKAMTRRIIIVMIK